MVRYEFDLAARSDDAELRRILRSTPMPGKVSLTFEREPSYFDAAAVNGPFEQVVICRDTKTLQAVGFGSRSIRDRYVNGYSQPIGYLSQLRLLENHRNGTLVARGYNFFRELHKDQRSPLYLTTIAKGNDRATAVLAKGRTRLPQYHPAGDYHTAVIPAACGRSVASRKADIRSATVDDLAAILQFLARVGPARQFFPKYHSTDFFAATGTFRNLRPAELKLAYRDQQIVGMLGGWDQHSFRQTIVELNSGPLRWSRPIYNFSASVFGRPRLPQSGESFRHVIGTLPLVENDDPDVFESLLDALLANLASEGHEYLLLGMHETDPLLRVALNRATTTYVTEVYCVCWSDGEALLRDLDERPLYLELGCL